LIKKDGHFEISVYNDELTKPVIVEMNIKIKQSFPGLPAGFYDVFSDRIKANGFTDQRLIDAVTHVIDNCIYPTPTIAQFISFDKNIKLYSYDQILKKNNELSGKAFEYYRPVKIEENQYHPYYAHVNDISKYKLNAWNNDESRKR
jgi:hypothetical protein